MINSKTKHICILGLMISLAFAFSYLESLIPLSVGIPGVKLGIANLVVIITLYVLNEKDAFAISVIRILMNGLFFSGFFSMLFSLSGGILSFLAMVIAKRTNKFSPIGVSALGGVIHNLGQIIIAGFVMNTYRIIYYFPILMFSGLITGIINGIIASIITNRLNKTGEIKCQ